MAPFQRWHGAEGLIDICVVAGVVGEHLELDERLQRVTEHYHHDREHSATSRSCK
jgi:hypothetical protein